MINRALNRIVLLLAVLFIGTSVFVVVEVAYALKEKGEAAALGTTASSI